MTRIHSIHEDYILDREDYGLPTAHGGCNCECHRWPGVSHVAPCCYPDDDMNDWNVSSWPPRIPPTGGAHEELKDLDQIDKELDEL